ncbi:MAG: polymerase subunit delta [Gammaproteobacteria bacterium]|nr:polymerase subunit delta [Gammaproteobacteria bacterium]
MSNIAYPPYPWQKESWEHLLQLKKLNRLPHALLLTGQAAVENTELAKCFAQFVLCRQPLSHSPCGECKDCLLFQSEDGHPDLSLMVPEGKLGIIKIEQIREILEKVLQTSQQGGYRVLIIKEAHAMNIASANALLKSLEEPGANCLFILISDKPHLLLPTIKSRCQQVFIKAELKDEETIQQQKEWVAKLLSVNDPLALAQEYQQADLSQLLNWTSLLLSDLIKIKSQVNLALAYTDSQLPMLETAAEMDLDQLYKLLDKCYRLQAESQLKISLNQQLILEDLLIEWVGNHAAVS